MSDNFFFIYIMKLMGRQLQSTEVSRSSSEWQRNKSVVMYIGRQWDIYIIISAEKT